MITRGFAVSTFFHRKLLRVCYRTSRFSNNSAQRYILFFRKSRPFTINMPKCTKTQKKCWKYKKISYLCRQNNNRTNMITQEEKTTLKEVICRMIDNEDYFGLVDTVAYNPDLIKPSGKRRTWQVSIMRVIEIDL